MSVRIVSREVAIERWPIAGAFTISRGSRTEAVVVVATLRDEAGHVGRGECVPYARYGETPEGVLAAVEGVTLDGLERQGLRKLLPGGAARNALDAALWDLEAKRAGVRAWELAGVPEPQALTTCYTLSVGAPDAMEAVARAASARPLLKVKLAGAGDPERLAAVRRAAPQARLVVDANEAWTAETLPANLRACEEAGVELIEQPCPAGADEALERVSTSIPICADESFHDRASLDGLPPCYRAVNVKLDKTGGLTEALEAAREARARGLEVMIGCMVGTSLAMAPATLLGAFARWVDLDGPLLLARDRPEGLRFDGSAVTPPGQELWG